MAASNAFLYISSSVCCCIFICGVSLSRFLLVSLVCVFLLSVSRCLLVCPSPCLPSILSPVFPSPCLLVCPSPCPYSNRQSPAFRDATHPTDLLRTHGLHKLGLCAAPRSVP